MTIDSYGLADIFPAPRRATPKQTTRHGMIGRAGSYRTPDGTGHIERNGRTWDAWRDDKPGITAHCDTMLEAAQYAYYG